MVSSRETSSLPSTSETPSRSVQCTVSGLAPAFWLTEVATTMTLSVRDATVDNSGCGAGAQPGVTGCGVVQRLDRHRLDLTDRLGLQLLHHLAERLDRGLEVGVELTDGAVVQRLHALGDGAGVHVDQDAGPVGGGLQHRGLVGAFVDVVAVSRPDQHRRARPRPPTTTPSTAEPMPKPVMPPLRRPAWARRRARQAWP